MRDNRKVGKTENERFLRFAPHVFSFLFTALICQSSAVGQSDAGNIEGQVIHRKEDRPLSQQLVILQIHQGSEDVQQRETVTDDNGVYIFDNLSTAVDVHYEVSTAYDGEVYVEKNLVLSEWVPKIKVNIEIVAYTDDSSKVKIRQHRIFILPPPADHAPDQAVSVVEMIHVENTSDSAFRIALDSQPTGLHFNLPEEYEALQIDPSFKQDSTAQTTRLVSNQPLEPGTSSFGFSYITHIGSGLDLSRKLTFDTDQVYVFIAEGTPLTSRSRILGAGRKEQVHEGIYTIYATAPATQLSMGQTADLRFKFDAEASQFQGGAGAMNGQPSNPKLIALIAISAALAGGFLVAAIFKIRAPTPPADLQDTQTAPDASWLRKLDAADIERTRLARLEMISRLEALYEKSEISERVYNRLRKEQADRLAAVLTQINR